jgi:hypothetical protein
MELDRTKMYNFPWTKTDNPGAWIEVTDICNLTCPGCFRSNNLEGHRPLETIKKEILQCIKMTKCSRISISGGEPLLYPDIIEVVKFIASLKIKCVILSNGELLTPDLARKFREAGLFQFFLHVDGAQIRPGWMNKTEIEMNELRQYYVDMIHSVGRIKCGFNMTIRQSNLSEVPCIVSWFLSNIDRVNHLSLIAFRGIPVNIADYISHEGQKAGINILPDVLKSSKENDITSNDIFKLIDSNFENIYPAAYLKGTLKKDTFKLISSCNVGSKSQVYGAIGAKSLEKHQLINHRIRGKYEASVVNFGKLVFLMAFIDKEVKRTLVRYLKAVIKNPIRLFEKIYVQSLNIQQPFEIVDNGLNLCDGCMNLMPHKDQMINSCRYDEYRLLGGPLDYSRIFHKDTVE